MEPVEPAGSDDLAMTSSLFVHDDNATDVDLLDFASVVAPIVAAIRSPTAGPLTVGIRGNWGSGKSTLLRLIRKQLAEDDRVLVIEVDPWAYESGDRMRASLIEEVLLELREKTSSASDEAKKKIKHLLARVRWGKVATHVLKGTVTLPVDGALGVLKKIVKGVVENPDDFVADAEDDSDSVLPTDMRGFREEFNALIEELRADESISKVVVLVDDLDRCLPATVVESLEAIKLFLSVSHMVFVLAADEAMVRTALAAHLQLTGRSALDNDDGVARFATQYLEKIIQLPFSLPFMTEMQAIAYASLLLCEATGDTTLYGELVNHCIRANRPATESPLAGFAREAEIASCVALATQVCRATRADRRMRPRQIKRFLNSLSVRQHIALGRVAPLSGPVMAKLLLLEEQHLPAFRVLVETPASERGTLIERWEAWGLSAADDGRPDDVPADTKLWAGTEPSLLGSPIDDYLTVAASLVAQFTASITDDKVASAVAALLDEADSVRLHATSALLPVLAASQVEACLAELSARRLGSPVAAARAVVVIAEARSDFAQQAATLLAGEFAGSLDTSIAMMIATSVNDDVKALAQSLQTNDAVDPDVKAALAEFTT